MARKEVKANAKGEVPLDLGFAKFNLKMTMEAVANAEDAFECDFMDLEDCLTSTRNIATFILILASAAGEDVGEAGSEERKAMIEKVRRVPVEVRDLMARIKAATGGGAEQDRGNAPAPTQ